MKKRTKITILSVVLVPFLLLSTGCKKQESVVQTETPPVETKTPPVETGTLSVQAGLVFRSGDVKRVARMELSLLDTSLIEILKKTGIAGPTPEDKEALKNWPDPMVLNGFILASLANKVANDSDWASAKPLSDGYLEAMSAIKSHSIQTTVTDFDGKAVFNSVPPGAYYLFGRTSMGQDSVIWNLMVVAKGGASSIILDNNNAAPLR